MRTMYGNDTTDDSVCGGAAVVEELCGRRMAFLLVEYGVGVAEVGRSGPVKIVRSRCGRINGKPYKLVLVRGGS